MVNLPLIVKILYYVANNAGYFNSQQLSSETFRNCRKRVVLRKFLTRYSLLSMDSVYLLYHIINLVIACVPIAALDFYGRPVVSDDWNVCGTTKR